MGREKKQIHDEMSIDEYVSKIQGEFNDYKHNEGISGEESLFNKHIRTTIYPSSIQLKQDIIASSIGLTLCIFAGCLVTSKSIDVRVEDYDLNLKHHILYPLFDDKIEKKETKIYMDDLKENEEIPVVIAGYPFGAIPGRMFKDMLYFILAYEKDGEMIWMNKYV
ncbi:hypothetical protein KY332_02470 [Candidatus Woesearchaeota archaeon]|nr:hypothetical protein [Candidatus Woesearchaeota archaeon]